jgi:DNA-directed RNA polymerase subunit delta
MKRIIKNYNNVEFRHLKLIAEAFPEGFSDEDLQSMTLADGRLMRCLEIRTDEVLYLFRIDRAMLEVLEEGMEEGFDMGNIDRDHFDDNREED